MPPQNEVFAQQGQIDWVNFAVSVPQYSIEFLARIQGAGAQPGTYAAVAQLATKFKLSKKGIERLEEAISRLGVRNSFSEVLYFGFGHRSLLRIMSETIGGLKMIALCACLDEVHSPVVTAKILSALWKEYHISEDFQPTIQQFKDLVKVCSGSLSTSPFPDIVDKILGPTSSRDESCSEPEDFAKALCGLFEITMGTKKGIVITGSYGCSFIAAIAYWLFDLDIHVEGHDGEILFNSSTGGQVVEPHSAQVYVKYNHGTVGTSTDLHLASTSYVVGSIRDLILLNGPHDTDFRHRLPWEHCLGRIFGRAFQHFLALESYAGWFFGSAARLYLALAEGESDIDDVKRAAFVHFADGCQGRGFIHTIEDFFPELRSPGLRRCMEEAYDKPKSAARSQLAECLDVLRNSCGCNSCSSSRSFDQQCLMEVAVAIFDLAIALGAVKFDSDTKLRPTYNGLRRITHSQRYKHRTDHSRQESLIAHICHDHNQGESIEFMLHDVACLFTGYEHPMVYNKEFSSPVEWNECMRTAFGVHGVCVFFEGLVSPSPHAEKLRHIHVIPGHIAKIGKGQAQVATQYEGILDLIKPLSSTQESVITHASRPGATSEPGNGVDEMVVDLSDTIVKDELTGLTQDITISAEVIDIGDEKNLTYFYRVQEKSNYAFVAPGWLTGFVLYATGMIKCERKGCSTEWPETIDLFQVISGWSPVIGLPKTIQKSPGKLPCTCIDWSPINRTDAARLLTLASYCGIDLDPMSLVTAGVVLRRDECLPCCLRYASRFPEDEPLLHVV